MKPSSLVFLAIAACAKAVLAGDTTVFLDNSHLTFQGHSPNGRSWGDKSNYNASLCGSVRATAISGASVSLAFKGSAVTINFIAGQFGGNATVLLDGKVSRTVTTFSPKHPYRDCVPLPVALSGLAFQTHTVTVVNVPLNSTFAEMVLHSFVYSGSPLSKNMHTAAIVGGVLGSLCAVLITVVIALYIRRHRQRQRQRLALRSLLDDELPKPPEMERAVNPFTIEEVTPIPTYPPVSTSTTQLPYARTVNEHATPTATSDVTASPFALLLQTEVDSESDSESAARPAPEPRSESRSEPEPGPESESRTERETGMGTGSRDWKAPYLPEDSSVPPNQPMPTSPTTLQPPSPPSRISTLSSSHLDRDLIRGLMDRNVPTSEISAIIRLMAADAGLEGSTAQETHEGTGAAEPPPEYEL